jgi:hypothetical protein
MTRNGAPFSLPTSCSWQMLGCDSRDAVRASRSNRCRASGDAEMVSEHDRDRSSRVSRAR